MRSEKAGRPRRKRAGQYNHGDLRRALIEQALRTIDRHGAEGLTLRGVGEALGVSRTALYRHFADKQTLMAAVALEGFESLRDELATTWASRGRGIAGFEAMAEAYLRFAIGHPAHYRVMFGRLVDTCALGEDLERLSAAAFHVLVDALVELQRDGLVRADDARLQAQFVWSVTHGIAMLVIDGRLGDDPQVGTTVNRYAAEQIRRALTSPA